MVATRPTRASALNTSHALAGRLIHGYVFSEGSGTTRNLVQPTASTTLQTGASWVASGGDSYVRTTNGGIESGVTTVIPQAPFHIVIGYRNAVDALQGQQPIMSALLDGNTYSQAASPFYFFHDGNGGWHIDGNAYYVDPAAGSDSFWSDPAASVYTAGPHHLHLAVSSTESTLYRNGTSLGSSSKVVPGTTPQMLRFGTAFNTTFPSFQADFDYVYIFQGSLTQTEIDDLRADPYALVVPATRFYLPSTGTATISPAFDSAWNDTSSVTSRPANTTRGTSAFAEITDTETSNSNTWDVCLGRYISEPLAAQTISGTVMGIIRARESNAAANARSQMVIRVVSGDGATVRGTLLAQDNTTTNINEWVATTTVTAARNARFPVGSAAATLTSVTAQAGDRLVIEVGGRAVNTSTTSYTLGLRFGENAADLANNETGTTEGAPWIEFSAGIRFQTAITPISGTSSSTTPKATTVTAAARTIPARTGTSSTTLAKATTTASAARTIPVRSGTATAVTPKAISAATGQASLPFSNQSLKFDADTGHIRYPFTSAWSFPDADWTVGVLASINSPLGNTQQVLISTGSYGNTNTFNFLFQEAGNANGGRFDCIVRGSDTAITISGANDLNLIDTTWRLWVVERVKSTETINIYHVPVNGMRTLYASLSVAGLGSIVPTVPAALATRAAPFVGSGVWFDGSIHSVFKIDDLLTAIEMQSIASGSDLVSDLGRAPVLLTRLKNLTSPVPNSGSVSGATGTINGSVVPVVGPTFLPTFFGSSSAILSLPTTTGSASRTIPARSGTSASTLPLLATAASGARVIPTRSGSSAVTLAKTISTAAGSRSITVRTGTSASSIVLPSASASGSRTIPVRSGTSAVTTPKAATASTGARAIPNRTGPSASTTPKLSSTASGSRTIGLRTGYSDVAVPRLTTAADGNRFMPSRDGNSASTVPKVTHSATGTRIPLPNPGTSAITLPKAVTAASGARTIPARTGTSAATLKVSTTDATGSRTITARTGTSAIALPKATTASAGSRTIPNRVGASAVTLSKATTASAGARTIPERSGTSASTISSVQHDAEGQRGIGGLDGISGIVLRAPTHSAAGSRTAPVRVGTSASTVPSLSATAAGTRIPPAITATSASTLFVPTTAANGNREAPPRIGTSAVTIPAVTSVAGGLGVIPAITGSSDATVPQPTTTGQGTRIPPEIEGASATSIGALSSIASGQRIPPAITGQSASRSPTPIHSSSGLRGFPIYDGSGDSRVKLLRSTGAGNRTAPVRDGTSASTTPKLGASGAGLVKPRTITGDSAIVLKAVNHNAQAARFLPGINGTSATRLSFPTHAATGLRIHPERVGQSAITLPFPSTASEGRFVVSGATDFANEVFLTASVNYEVHLTGTVVKDIQLIGQVRVA